MSQNVTEFKLNDGKVHIAVGIFCLIAGAAAIVLPCDKLFKGLGILLLTVLAAAGIFLLVVGRRLAANSAKSLKAIEPYGGISVAADDYAMPSTVCIDKNGKAAFGKQFIFALDSGNIYTYDEVGWAYISVSRKDGVPTAQVLTIQSKNGRSMKMASEKPDKTGTQKLLMYLELIKAYSPDCLIGYSKENAALWKNRSQGADSVLTEEEFLSEK